MQTAGFVLAGGASSRMGTNKAFLLYQGRTLLDIAISAVRDTAGNVTVIGSPELYNHLGLPVTPDLRPHSGPLAGIETALTHAAAAGSAWTLVTACDMPRLTAATLHRILNKATEEPDAAAVFPESAPGRLEPLCAAWHIRALPFVSHALDAGIRKVTTAVPETMVRYIRLTDEEAFQNLNTPEEWRLALSGTDRH